MSLTYWFLYPICAFLGHLAPLDELSLIAACHSTIDLAMEYDSFEAARAALAGVVSMRQARDVAAVTTASIPD